MLKWASQQERNLPWKQTKDPYKIWLSEIILQQTRVEQGMPYYIKFVEHYPTVLHLANASEDQVLKDWEGLGYYTRARNLHQTAKHIAYQLNGVFPSTHQGILALKGVGAYTAAAIASFAFQLPHAVLDGNVFRVLSRFFGIDTPIDSPIGKKIFEQLAQELLDPSQPDVYNQAIMDFGATWCMPKQPNCRSCPMRDHCVAHMTSSVAKYPVKEKKMVKRKRFFHYLMLHSEGQIMLEKRIEKDIWQGLYQFPLIEAPYLIQDTQQILNTDFWKTHFVEVSFKIHSVSKTFKQLLTHQQIFANFWDIHLSHFPQTLREKTLFATKTELNNFAFPKIIDCYFEEKALYLGFNS